ncbi:hypothetical protein AAMO2058_000328100 [Amorphochlora amoebiformis]
MSVLPKGAPLLFAGLALATKSFNGAPISRMKSPLSLATRGERSSRQVSTRVMDNPLSRRIEPPKLTSTALMPRIGSTLRHQRSRSLMVPNIKRDKDGGKIKKWKLGIQNVRREDIWNSEEFEGESMSWRDVRGMGPFGILRAIFLWLLEFSRTYIRFGIYWWAFLMLWMFKAFLWGRYFPVHKGADTHWMHEVKKHLYGVGNFDPKGTAGMEAYGGVLWSCREWRFYFPDQWFP